MLRRTRRLLAAGMPLVLVGLVVAAAVAPPASALSCPAGMIQDIVSPSLCLDPNTGKYSSGAVSPANKAVQLSKPSSVYAGVNGLAGTSYEKSQGVRTQEALSGGKSNKVGVLGKVATKGGGLMALVSGFSLGMTLGGYFDSFACGQGLTALCMPKDPVRPPNTDVTVVNDSGVVAPVSNVCGRLSVSTVSCPYVTPITVESTGVPNVVLGQKDVPVQNWFLKITPDVPVGGAPPNNTKLSLSVDVNCLPLNATVANNPYSQAGGAGSGASFSWSTSLNRWTSGPNAYADVKPFWTVACPTAPATQSGLAGIALVDSYGLTSTRWTAVNFAANAAPPAGCGSRPAGWTAAGKCQELVYRVPGDTLRPPETVDDPVRTLRTENTCTPIAGGAPTVVSSSSLGFRETDAAMPSFPEPGACPAGTTLTQTQVKKITPGLPDEVIWTFVTPAEVVQAQQQHTECLGGFVDSCKLGLWKLDGADWRSCFAIAGLCEGWFSDPDRDALYRCTYGPANAASDADVGLGECNAYAPSFDAQRQAQGIAYADPATGTVPDTALDPATQPEVATPGGTEPAGGSLPGAGVDGDNCFPSGWGLLNPVEWVLKPLKCALVWAFVPDGAVLTQTLQDTKIALTSKPPFSVVAAVSAFAMTFADGALGECNGSLISVEQGGLLPQDLTIPCEPPDVPGLGTLRALVVVGMFVGLALLLWRDIDDGMRK